MSKNLYLVRYQDQNYFDDTSEKLGDSFLGDDVYENLKKYIGKKEILESKDTDKKILINYIKNEFISEAIRCVLIPECIKGSEQIDKETIIDKDMESKFFLLEGLISILRLAVTKRDKYNDNDNVLLMVG